MAAAGTVIEHPNGLRIEIATTGTGRAARAGRTVVFHQRTRVLPAAAATQPAETAVSADGTTAAASTAAEATPVPRVEAQTDAAHVDAAQTDASQKDASQAAAAAESGAAVSALHGDPAPDSPDSSARVDAPAAATVANAANASSSAASVAAADSKALATPAEMAAAAEVASESEWISSTWTSGVPWAEVLGRGKLIAGLESALDGARAGCKLHVRIPAALAYGEAGNGAIPPDRSLEVELELVEVR
jgi:hypothetical protein